PLPHAFVLELAENVVDRRAWRKGIAGQITPGATGAQQIEDRVHRRTHVGLARSSACLGRGDQRLQPRPAHPSDHLETRCLIVCAPRDAPWSTFRITCSPYLRRP